MDNDAPLRGADLFNNELEVGFNRRFERHWSRAEGVGRVVMALLVAAALAGLLGRGPFSHHTVHAPDQRMLVDFEPLARYGTSTQVTFHLHPAPGQDTVRLFLGSVFVEPMGLQQIIPQPARQEAGRTGMLLTFAVPPGVGDAMVRLVLKPGEVGPVEITARQGDEAEMRWTQVVMP